MGPPQIAPSQDLSKLQYLLVKPYSFILSLDRQADSHTTTPVQYLRLPTGSTSSWKWAVGGW